jgi:hypothetical protein
MRTHAGKTITRKVLPVAAATWVALVLYSANDETQAFWRGHTKYAV